MQNTITEKMNIKIKSEEQREKIEMLVVENNNLKDKIHSQDSEMKKLNKEINRITKLIDDENKTKE